MEVLPKRFGKYGLTLHPEKTRLVPFPQPPYRWRPGRRGNSEALGFRRPGTFDLLGFTHYWGKTRGGGWALCRQTAASRFRRSVRAIYEWLRHHRHLPIVEQHRALSRKLRGHWAYYGITGNYRRLAAFRHVVVRAWQKWLNRRSRGNHMPWSRFTRLLVRYPLPRAQVVHSVCRRVANPCS